jgi:hypothetical protein
MHQPGIEVFTTSAILSSRERASAVDLMPGHQPRSRKMQREGEFTT